MHKDMVPRQYLLQYSSPAHMACIRKTRLGTSTSYKEGKMTGKKRDESLPEQSAEWKPLPSTEEEFPSGCHPRMIWFPRELCTLVSRHEQRPRLLTAVPSPGSICESSGAHSCAPATLGSSSLTSAWHSGHSISSHLLPGLSKNLHSIILTPVCHAGACSLP